MPFDFGNMALAAMNTRQSLINEDQRIKEEAAKRATEDEKIRAQERIANADRASREKIAENEQAIKRIEAQANAKLDEARAAAATKEDALAAEKLRNMKLNDGLKIGNLDADSRAILGFSPDGIVTPTPFGTVLRQYTGDGSDTRMYIPGDKPEDLGVFVPADGLEDYLNNLDLNQHPDTIYAEMRAGKVDPLTKNTVFAPASDEQISRVLGIAAVATKGKNAQGRNPIGEAANLTEKQHAATIQEAKIHSDAIIKLSEEKNKLKETIPQTQMAEAGLGGMGIGNYELTSADEANSLMGTIDLKLKSLEGKTDDASVKMTESLKRMKGTVDGFARKYMNTDALIQSNKTSLENAQKNAGRLGKAVEVYRSMTPGGRLLKGNAGLGIKTDEEIKAEEEAKRKAEVDAARIKTEQENSANLARGWKTPAQVALGKKQDAIVEKATKTDPALGKALQEYFASAPNGVVNLEMLNAAAGAKTLGDMDQLKASLQEGIRSSKIEAILANEPDFGDAVRNWWNKDKEEKLKAEDEFQKGIAVRNWLRGANSGRKEGMTPITEEQVADTWERIKKLPPADQRRAMIVMNRGSYDAIRLMETLGVFGGPFNEYPAATPIRDEEGDIIGYK